MGLLSSIKVAGDPSVEVPHSHHPVVVQPPQAKRSEFPFTGFIDFQGLRIDVENKRGDYRRGKDKDGHEWKVLMHNHYGEIRDTEGVDGDNLDVYVGPNHDASTVVVIRQHRPDTGAFDEDKVMVGFDSVEEAIGAYKKQYDKPGFYKDGDYLAMPIGRFWRWVHDEKKQGKKVAAAASERVIRVREHLRRKRESTKKAEHVPEPAKPVDVAVALRPVLTCLLALYQLYYFAHWTARGKSFYSDHELFTRLYKSTQEEFDQVAERAVGHLGAGALDGVFTLAAAKNTDWVNSGSSPLQAAWLGEQELLRVVLAAYRSLDAAAGLTLGLDDLLMQLASAHETNTYLLRQRIDEPLLKAASVR